MDPDGIILKTDLPFANGCPSDR